MTNNKFKLTNVSKVLSNGITVYRIQALKNFANVKNGDLGGYVQTEKNLSQDGECWIYNNAVVCDTARVTDNAIVTDNAFVGGNACVAHQAVIQDNAIIIDKVLVCEYARMIDNSKASGWSTVTGTALLRDRAEVIGDAYISFGTVKGNTVITEFD